MSNSNDINKNFCMNQKECLGRNLCTTHALAIRSYLHEFKREKVNHTIRAFLRASDAKTSDIFAKHMISKEL